MLGGLPQTLKVNGKSYPINSDYRNILQIISAYADPELKDEEKVYILLRRIYQKSFQDIPAEDYADAVRVANHFIECENDHDDRPSPRVVNWEKDEQLIFPAVNKVAGMEIRSVPYMHWWTFYGYFQNIDPEGTWGFILTLRSKKAKGKKLEKHEKEFWKANRLLCAIDRPKEMKGAKDRLDRIFDDLMTEAEQEGGEKSDGE